MDWGAGLDAAGARGRGAGRGEKDQVKKDKVKFLFPYTTPLIELRLDRQPLPLDGPNDVC